MCGGSDTRDTCLKWSSDTGSWDELLTLDIGRYYHVYWTPVPGMGTYLMGGMSSPRTTTLIKDDGTQEPAFHACTSYMSGGRRVRKYMYMHNVGLYS